MGRCRKSQASWNRSVFLRDQAWAHMRAKRAAIQRIYKHGPQNREEACLLRQVVGVILGEIAFRDKELQAMQTLAAKDDIAE